jgi:arylsulfatase A-like enzyme
MSTRQKKDIFQRLEKRNPFFPMVGNVFSNGWKKTALLFFPMICFSEIAEKQPNILFILTDDQGYGDLARHGHPLLKTPNLDRLYDQSVRFDNFYVSASCAPTRAGLMTGMHEFRNGLTHTVPPRERVWRDATMLPQLLKEAGYVTGIVGKWHLGDGPGYAPKFRGFDHFAYAAGGGNSHFNPDMVRDGVREKATGFRTDLFFDEGMKFIDQYKDRPFFYMVSTHSPHTPLAAPEEFIAPYRDQVDEKTATYLGMVANIDTNVGRILKHLDELGLTEKTIVVFMNDNGATMGAELYNAGMRGVKCTAWQGGVRAMSFWRWPGRWQPHTVSNMTAHLDFLPTLCDLAGVEIPASVSGQLEGFSLRPLLESEKKIAWHDDRMLFHHTGRWPSGMAAEHKYSRASVMQGDYLLVRSGPCEDPECKKYISECNNFRSVLAGGIASYTTTPESAQFHWGVTPPGRWALFNLREDPRCERDLWAGKPELVETLSAAYEAWWDSVFPVMIERGGDAGEPRIKGESLEEYYRRYRESGGVAL